MWRPEVLQGGGSRRSGDEARARTPIAEAPALRSRRCPSTLSRRARSAGGAPLRKPEAGTERARRVVSAVVGVGGA